MYNRVLVLSPHTDDGELGCGGFMAKLAGQGSDIFYVAFSAAEKSVPEGLPEDILRKEVSQATEVLGVRKENLSVLNYEVRTFPAWRQEILEDLIKFRAVLAPDLVLCPSLHDIHQDHNTVANEALRAFKTTTVFSYELPWNNLSLDTTCFVRLSEKDIECKVKALQCYESQKQRYYFDQEFIGSLARTRGTQVGCRYAEVFEVLRLII